ncbi:MAG: UbiA family prenyltransferase [Balneolaceae bacterium]|nr:UbiA family prenyltransferase [Balneolaceae bacterium]
MNVPETHRAAEPVSLPRQVLHFAVHLRPHYQLGILSGCYLLGGALAGVMPWGVWLAQLLNVHLLLFGGATAYNSYWDRDTGPVGGLRHPPPMRRWMLPASLALQGVGLLLAWWLSGFAFAAVYALSMLLFWLYSTPHARWKGAPLKSLAAIGISTGINGVLMGYLAASPGYVDAWVAAPGALGATLVILSLYPVSQAYQAEEDRARGDRTFALVYGPVGVVRFFTGAWGAGVLLLTCAFWPLYPRLWLVVPLVLAALALGGAIRRVLREKIYRREGYRTVMRIKYGASLFFVALLTAVLLLRHA